MILVSGGHDFEFFLFLSVAKRDFKSPAGGCYYYSGLVDMAKNPIYYYS